MIIPRNFSIFVQYILDEWVPPAVRDSKLFMYVPMRIVLKESAGDFMSFKEWVFTSPEKRLNKLYESSLHNQELQGETDLNLRCAEEILLNIKGKKVLEVGCGRGYLANRMSKVADVTAADIVVDPKLKKKYPNVKFVSGTISNLKFKDNEFDIVVTTHTIEHVRDTAVAISEIRRVAKESIIVVVPRQRPYKYTFSLHTQFFPYKWSLENIFGEKSAKATIKKLGDWYYQEPQ